MGLQIRMRIDNNTEKKYKIATQEQQETEEQEETENVVNDQNAD